MVMRVGFISGRSCSIENGRLFADAGLGRLIDALHDRSELRVALSVAPTRPSGHDHALRLPRHALVPMPHITSTEQATALGAACRKAIHNIERSCDVSIIQLPFAPPWALLPSRHPRVFHACADVEQIAVANNRYGHGWRRLAAPAMATLMHTWQRRLAAQPRARVVSNGIDLLHRLGAPGRALVSTTLRAEDIGSVTRLRPQNAPPRVLFVGFLRAEKGIDVLVDAFKLLRQRLPNVELHIVGGQGWTAGSSQAGFQRDLEEWQQTGAATFHGQVAFGPALFRHYADADVLVLPSLSEGTPRVLVEARAFGCPVVASRVGGIPSSVDDGIDGVLVPSEDPHALANALHDVLAHPQRRDELSKRGLDRVRTMTIDAFADALLAEAELAVHAH